MCYYTQTTIPFRLNTKDTPFQIALVIPVDSIVGFFKVMVITYKCNRIVNDKFVNFDPVM